MVTGNSKRTKNHAIRMEPNMKRSWLALSDLQGKLPTLVAWLEDVDGFLLPVGLETPRCLMFPG